MTEQLFPATFPRFAGDEAALHYPQIADATPAHLRESSTIDDAGMTYYELAVGRVSRDVLSSAQRRIREIADQVGYPVSTASARVEFDRILTTEILDLFPMIPADAADDRVWSFVAMRMCPEVAVWRFPPKSKDEEGKTVTPDRFMGSRRNVFQRLWWRAYVLGEARVEELLEDECVQVMDRSSIGGYPRLARLLTIKHLERLETSPKINRRNVMREATKRILRKMGYFSVFALNDEQLRELVDGVLDESWAAVRSKSDDKSTPTASATVEQVEHVEHVEQVDDTVGSSEDTSSDRPDGVLNSFRIGCADYWPFVEPLLDLHVTDEFLETLRVSVREYVTALSARNPLARILGGDIGFLLSAAPRLTAEGRAVVAAAAKYFIHGDDAIPDYYASGLDDDEYIVEAAYQALEEVFGARGP